MLTKGKIVTRTWKAPGPTGRTIRKTSFGYSVRLDGKQKRVVRAEWTRDDALAALHQRLEEAARPPAETPVTRTFGEVAAEYLVHKANEGKRSLREDKRILNKQLLPAFAAALPMRELRPATIAQYGKRRIGEVSAYTASNELSVLRHLLRLARRWGYLESVPEIDLPRKPEGRMRYLEEKEITRLLDACAKTKNPYLKTIVTLAVSTGMRKSEILGLTWERVDLSADYGLSASATLYKTKSGKPRGVPLNADAVAVLQALYKESCAGLTDDTKPTGLVFCRRNGKAWGQIRTAFESALEKAEITGFRFHDLRHTAASHMVMRGATLKEVQEVLGHADFKMTMRYAHLSPGHLRGAVARLEGLTTPPKSAHEVHMDGRIEASAS